MNLRAPHNCRIAVTTFLTLLLLVCFAPSAEAQNFLTSDFHTASLPRGIKAADVNKDGHLDLILVSAPPNSSSSDLVVHLGHGDGTFGPPLTFHSGITWPAQESVLEFEVLDVNHDGKPDLVYVGGDKLGIMLGNGDGTFQPPQLFQGSAMAPPAGAQGFVDALNSLGVADFDKDGNVDFVASSWLNIEVFYGNGDGTVKPVQIFTVGRPQDDPNGRAFAGNAEAGDFDGDGNADITFTIDTGNDFGSSIYAWYGDASGGFADRRLVEDQVPPFSGVKVNDLNKDGHPDISGIYHNCVFEGPCSEGPFTYIFSGNRLFKRTINGDSATNGGPSFADFNKDGLADIVAIGCRFVTFQDGVCGEDLAQIYPLNADGSPASPQVVDIASSADQNNPSEVVAGDFNDDGRADFAITLQGTDRVMVFLNAGGTTDNSPCGTGSFHTVHVCWPSDGSTTTSPVKVVSTANSDRQIMNSAVYVDGVKTHQTGTAEVHTALPMSPGSHRLTIKSWDDAGNQTATTTLTVNVASSGGGGGGGGNCTAPSSAKNNTVTICAPAPGSSVASPVRISATAKSTGKISAMKIYVDGVSKFSQTTGPSLSASLTMQPGTHRITVKAWVGSTSFSSAVTITVH